VVTEVVIDRPCAAVAEYAGDPSNATQWYANIESAEWWTAPPMRVGSTMDFVRGSSAVGWPTRTRWSSSYRASGW
jgi:hypothetical protein